MPELPPKPAGAVTGWSRQLLVARPRFEFPATVGRRLHETDFAPHVRNDGRSVGPDPLAPTTCGVAPSVGPTSRLSGQKRLDQLLQPLNHDGWWRVFGSLRARQILTVYGCRSRLAREAISLKGAVARQDRLRRRLASSDRASSRCAAISLRTFST
jgi:hypothetical protein